MKKRILSLLVAAVLVISLLPMAAFAADPKVVFTVKADKTVVNQDEDITFTVYGKSTVDLVALQLYIAELPEGLTYKSSGLASATLKEDLGSDGAADWTENIRQLAVGSSTPLKMSDEIALFTFTVTAAKGGNYSVTIDLGANNEGCVTELVGGASGDLVQLTPEEYSIVPATVTVNKTRQTLDSLTLAYDKDTIAISGTSLTGSATATVTATDTDGDAMDLSKVTDLKFVTEPATVAGVTVADNGNISVDKSVAAGTFTVTAVSGSVKSAPVTITVTKEAPALADLVMDEANAATALIPAGDTANTYVYKAKAVDQYGAEMADQAITWSAELGETGATFDAATATLSVSKDAKPGEVTITAAAGEKTAEMKVNLTNIAFEGVASAVTATDGTYGDKLSDLVKVDSSKLTATAGGPVAGTYTLVDADTVPDAGDAVAYTVVFNSTDGNYKNIVVTTGTVKVAKKVVTVTANDVTVRVGNDLPEINDEEFGYTVSAMVGTDKLEGTATYKFYVMNDDDSKGAEVTTVDTDEVGYYYIEVSGLTASANYDVQFVDGVLTVRKKIVATPTTGGTTGTPAPNTPTTSTQPDGTKVTVTVADDGTVTAEVEMPKRLDSTVVTVPVQGADNSLVPVVVDENGNETVVKHSVATEDGVVMELTDSATVKLVEHNHHFADATNHWAEDSIHFVHSREIFNGTSDTTFEPNAPMSRAMIATVLYRLDGEHKADVAAAFQDVAEGTWYTEGVAWAAEKEIVKGLSADTFAPDDNVTREQLAAMLYRYAGSPAVSPAANMAGYEDFTAISDWAQDAMRWAVENGILNGKDNGLLDPQGNATRAEVATMIVRYVTLTLK